MWADVMYVKAGRIVRFSVSMCPLVAMTKAVRFVKNNPDSLTKVFLNGRLVWSSNW